MYCKLLMTCKASTTSAESFQDKEKVTQAGIRGHQEIQQAKCICGLASSRLIVLSILCLTWQAFHAMMVVDDLARSVADMPA